MTFPSFHFTTLIHSSHPRHSLLPFTSLHCILDEFTPHLHFAIFITFLILFLKLLDLQERVPKTSAGSWFQSWMVLYTKEYFLIPVFCFLLLIFLIDPAQIAFSRVCIEESMYTSYLSALCQGFPIRIVSVIFRFSCHVLHPV
jgi:hypothetical protein